MSKSLYEVIGVSPNADKGVIEAKCLELGRKYHPDSNPNNLDVALKYKEVMLAYSTLTDLNKRLEYDASLKNNSSNNPMSNITNAFNSIFGNKKPRKEVGLGFAVAIVFVPWIAAWFLLKDGYSRKARIISFTWLTLFLVVYFKPEPTPEQIAEKQARQETRDLALFQQKQSEQLEEQQKSRENRVMGTWKIAVQEILRDPDSADFQKVVFVTDVSGTPYACGDVNSKNGMGGYVGYRGFITSGDKNSTLLEGETKNFSKYWNDICVNGKRIRH